MRKRRRAGEVEEDEHFWPGYVDALTNVVINLLFLLAIFLLAVMVASTAKYKGAEVQKKGGQVFDVSVSKKVEPDERVNSTNALRVESTAGERFTLYKLFVPKIFNASLVSPEFLGSKLKMGDPKNLLKIEIWCNSSRSSDELRASYFIINAIRAVIEKLGVSSEKIFTRIYTEDEVAFKSSSTKQYSILIRYE